MRKVRPAVLEMLSRLDEFKQRVGQIDNRAVFEVPDILAGILDRRAAAAS